VRSRNLWMRAAWALIRLLVARAQLHAVENEPAVGVQAVAVASSSGSALSSSDREPMVRVPQEWVA
jgi:hypothetical protein